MICEQCSYEFDIDKQETWGVTTVEHGKDKPHVFRFQKCGIQWHEEHPEHELAGVDNA